MSALAKLKLVASKRTTAQNPVQQRRNKLAGKIAEQIALATARIEGRVYAPTKMRTVTDSVTGERRTVEVHKRVKEWFWTADTGKSISVLDTVLRRWNWLRAKMLLKLSRKLSLLTR